MALGIGPVLTQAQRKENAAKTQAVKKEETPEKPSGLGKNQPSDEQPPSNKTPEKDRAKTTNSNKALTLKTGNTSEQQRKREQKAAAKKSRRVWLNMQMNPSSMTLKQIACLEYNTAAQKSSDSKGKEKEEAQPQPEKQEVSQLLKTLIRAIDHV